MQIRELVEQAHANAEKHGFWEDFQYNADFLDYMLQMPTEDKYAIHNSISTRLMLIVSELGEALEGLRKCDMSNFREELADVAIRLGDLCGGLNIDLEREIKKKMGKNKNRPYKHGKEF
ncbi:nucleotide pyrophosphohydrolase [Clostridium sp. MSJ-11]|uniref:Nucleotide pyrophosphohydrolase n=1 Tax=Clostridium mobile TaxID=2841512 RepID=A0ABS6EMM7_9CLOT|nr:MazG nucleotide pyrophosphohydrolase domain-containing protein [Clostridium mobile]MBU5486495.1 nucleotide pyrophosphohydrolase [Clostridium mobile]